MKGIYKKLLEVQKIGVNAEKDGKNPHFKSSYVTLDSLLATLLPIATANEIAVTSFLENGELVSRATDPDDESFIESRFPIKNADPQKAGSEITYAKRYNLWAIFNLTTWVDDDANSASGDNFSQTMRPDLMDYITRIKETTDTNELQTIYAEAYTLFKTEKQREWLVKEKDLAKNRINSL